MKSRVSAKLQLTSALLSALLVGRAAAESVLIHEEPTHPNFIHPVFTINPDRGRVAVQVSVNDFPGDYDSNYSDYRKLMKGLVYDRVSNEILCLRREAEGGGGRQRLRQSLFLQGDGSLPNGSGKTG
jgi:hypothetical protein